MRSFLVALFCQEDDSARIDWASVLTIFLYAALFGLVMFVLFVMPLIWGGLPRA